MLFRHVWTPTTFPILFSFSCSLLCQGAFVDPGVGYSLVRAPVSFSCSSTHGAKGPAPALGEHNAEVLHEVGYSKLEVREFSEAKAAFLYEP
jgi:crotonobetainyl-CoA:carnitine CoA-transferase CaiB-like acyl-CoA transferase